MIVAMSSLSRWSCCENGCLMWLLMRKIFVEAIHEDVGVEVGGLCGVYGY